MTTVKFAAKLLRAATALAFVTTGIGVASAQTTGGSMAGMQMGPGSKMGTTRTSAAAAKAAPTKTKHKKGAHHKAK